MNNGRRNFFGLMLAITSGIGGIYLHRATNDNKRNKLIQKTIGLKVGDRRPDFSLPDLEGQQHNIANWDGKTVLINFWASWCTPCVREMPVLQRIHLNYQKKGVKVIGIALDKVENIQNFLHDRNRQITYPILHGQYKVSKLMQLFGNQYSTLPYTITLNDKGEIASIAAKGELNYAQIEALLKPLLTQ